MTETMQINVNNRGQGKGSSEATQIRSLLGLWTVPPISLQEQMSIAIRMSHVNSEVSVQTHFRLC